VNVVVCKSSELTWAEYHYGNKFANSMQK